MRQLLLKESLTDDITIAPFVDSKSAVSIGHSDPTLLLEMFKILLQLHQKFLSGKRGTHSFTIYLNNTHWVAASWIGKRSKTHLWLGMNSIGTNAYSLEPICHHLQKLITQESALQEIGRRILTQACQELKPLHSLSSGQALLSYKNPIQALLEVYLALTKIQSSVPLQQLLDAEQRSQFQQIAGLIKKFVTSEIAGDFAACTEMIKALEKSPAFTQPSSAAALTAPGSSGLLASSSSSSPSSAPSMATFGS